MLRKANQMLTMAYIRVTTFFEELGRELKNDERGVDGVVVAVLLLLIGVLAVSALWKVLGPYIQNKWKEITDQSFQQFDFNQEPH